MLQATPSSVTKHELILGLVKELRTLWRDAGASLATPDRQADLVALDQIRRRHLKIVTRAMREGGIEVATVVLARLALVEEMLEPASKRLTGEVPWDLQRPYNVVASSLVNLTQGRSMHPLRRRRWLQCPHAPIYAVLGGEVWRQTLKRFSSVDVAWDPLSQCLRFPLTQHEFRLALCLMEISLSERVAMLMYEGVTDLAGAGSTEGNLKSFVHLVNYFGQKGSGDVGIAVKTAAAAKRANAQRDAARSSMASLEKESEA